MEYEPGDEICEKCELMQPPGEQCADCMTCMCDKCTARWISTHPKNGRLLCEDCACKCCDDCGAALDFSTHKHGHCSCQDQNDEARALLAETWGGA